MSASAQKLPRISIVTPSLNQGAFIEKTILSVIEQDYPDIEYIVMDGGSTDNTVEILKKYDGRIAYWQSEPDGGQSAAINAGLRRATGEIVAYINSDDWYYLGAFRTAAALLADGTHDWCAAAAVNVDPVSGKENVIVPSPLLEDRAKLVAIPWGVHQSGCFWRRSVHDAVGYFRDDLHYVLDTEFWIRLILHGHLPALSETIVAGRLLQIDSKTCQLRPRFAQEQLRFHEFFRPLLREEEARELDFWFAWKRFWLAWHNRQPRQAAAEGLRLAASFPLRSVREAFGRASSRFFR